MFGRKQPTQISRAGNNEVHVTVAELDIWVNLVAWLNPDDYSDDRAKDAIALAQRADSTPDAILMIDA